MGLDRRSHRATGTQTFEIGDQSADELSFDATGDFDLPKAEREQRNLLLFLADEFQHFTTSSEDGLSDHSMVDVIREAGAAFLLD